MTGLPETVLQFGAGQFLRAFADLFIHQANAVGQATGRIVVVQSTGSDRAEQLNRNSSYHVAVRGYENGQLIDRVDKCHSISRALAATIEWPAVLDFATSLDLRFIISNTTEAGYSIGPSDDVVSTNPPHSFPAKLLAILVARWKAGLSPVTLLPCELRENNAVLLRGIVGDLAARQRQPQEFQDWQINECHWLCSLVDRIVPGPPTAHSLLAADPLLLQTEPYALWALEESPTTPPFMSHPALVRTADVTPYFLRKVRILNGAHTALVAKVGLKRFETVLDAMNDADTAEWLNQLLLEEIVPVIDSRVENAAGFALRVLERFRNPFFRHRLSDIAKNHKEKTAIRLESTRREHVEMFGKEPKLLSQLL